MCYFFLLFQIPHAEFLLILKIKQPPRLYKEVRFLVHINQHWFLISIFSKVSKILSFSWRLCMAEVLKFNTHVSFYKGKIF